MMFVLVGLKVAAVVWNVMLRGQKGTGRMRVVAENQNIGGRCPRKDHNRYRDLLEEGVMNRSRYLFVRQHSMGRHSSLNPEANRKNTAELNPETLQRSNAALLHCTGL